MPPIPIIITAKAEEFKLNQVAKFSWQVKEEEWKTKQQLALLSKTSFPGSFTGRAPITRVGFSKDQKSVGITILWPTNVLMDKIEMDTKISFKSNDWLIVLEMKPDVYTRQVVKENGEDVCHAVSIWKDFKSSINPEKMYDEQRCFTIEAKVQINYLQSGGIKEKLLTDVLNIYHDEKSADITLVVGDKKFECHKAIMCARSKVFNKMFTHETLEKQTGIVCIEDDVTAEIVKAFIKFVYLGKLPTTTATDENGRVMTKLYDVDHYFVRGLLHLATKYQVHSLQALCVQKLVDCLDVATCIPMYMLVTTYIPTNVELKEDVKQFMTCKVEEVVEREDWYILVQECTDLATELFKSIEKEVQKKHLCKNCIIQVCDLNGNVK